MVNSNFTPQDKKPGDLILSADWNAAMGEIKRLEKAKVNREGADTLKGPLTIQEALNVTGDVKISGSRLKSADGWGILETNKKDWLRINPDENYPAIALYKPVAIGTGGLAIGEWGQLPQGVLKVTQSAYLATAGGNVGIGTTSPDFHLQVGSKDILGTWKLGVSGRGSTGNYRQWTLRTGDGTISTEIHKLRIRDEQANSDRVTIDENGNVIFTGTVTAIGNFVGDITIDDTRDVNEAPTVFRKQVSFDFKKISAVGVPGSGTFSGMLTIAPWSDNSGNAHHQLNFNQGGIFWRQGQPDASSWGTWYRIPNDQMADNFSFMGKVSIGTTSPDFHLQVGSKDIVGTWKLGVSGRGSTGNYRQWTLRTGDGTISTEIHKLRIRDEQANSDRVTIDENGNVVFTGTVTAASFVGVGAFVVGMILMWSGLETNVPTGWALCNGQNGTPDLRGRFVLSSGQGAGLTNRTLNQTGGVEKYALTVNEMPTHSHTITDPGHFHNWTASRQQAGTDDNNNTSELSRGDAGAGDPISKDTDKKTTNITIQNQGGNQAHENMPPFYVLAYIMKI